MTVEISEFVKVNISVSPVGISSGNFGILGFLTNEEGIISSAERARAYTSLAGVGGDWATSSEVYKAATAFYGQTPTPTDFVVLMCYETAQPASLYGGTHETLEDLKLRTTDSLDITVDGTLISVVIDLSTAVSLQDIANLVEAELDAVELGTTCTYSNGFVISSPTTGVASTITFGSNDLAEALGLETYQALIEQGLDIETPVEALAVAHTKGVNWVATVLHKKYRDITGQAAGENTEDVAVWSEAAEKVFCNTSNNLNCKVGNISTDIGSILQALSLRYSLTTFSSNPSQYASAAAFGRAASVNFNNIGTTITLNLKQLAGVSAENVTAAEFATLRAKNISTVVAVAGGAIAYTDSRMASGSWLDTTHGLAWLKNRIEVDMFNLLYTTTTKVPFTQTGINQAIATLTNSLNAAVSNGLCSPGFLPDGRFLSQGFIITSTPLGDVSVGDKGNRIYNGLSFEMVGTGALHEVYIDGSFSE